MPLTDWKDSKGNVPEQMVPPDDIISYEVRNHEAYPFSVRLPNPPAYKRGVKLRRYNVDVLFLHHKLSFIMTAKNGHDVRAYVEALNLAHPETAVQKWTCSRLCEAQWWNRWYYRLKVKWRRRKWK